MKASEAAVAEAAGRLRDGDVVVFPTETVYGLGADTFNDTALERVYELKGRPAANPLIAHVTGPDQAQRVVAAWDDRCSRLASSFWPGPLTLVLPRAETVPDRATAGWPTIAVRAPDHPVALELLETFGGPVSAPSANRSGRVSPTTAAHVAGDFADIGDLLILDGGPCAVGIESTVLDLCGDVPAILRPGAVSAEALASQLDRVAVAAIAAQTHSPGTSSRHYAPQTPAELVPRGGLPARLVLQREPVVALCLHDAEVSEPHRAIVMPGDARGYAARLYTALREADAGGVTRILIEEPPGRTGLWQAVRDRLRRATEREPLDTT